LRQAALERGLLVGTAGEDVLRLAPPLIVTEDEVREAVDLIDQCLAGQLVQAGA
jgi:acetylornithine/N-succinyldiaminopimelate aminotransferase